MHVETICCLSPQYNGMCIFMGQLFRNVYSLTMQIIMRKIDAQSIVWKSICTLNLIRFWNLKIFKWHKNSIWRHKYENINISLYGSKLLDHQSQCCEMSMLMSEKDHDLTEIRTRCWNHCTNNKKNCLKAVCWGFSLTTSCCLFQATVTWKTYWNGWNSIN
jgi:hypothetical protein